MSQSLGSSTVSPRRRRYACTTGALLLGALLVPGVASAQVDNVVNFGLGAFGIRAEDARGENDVLYRNLDYLYFELDDFNGFTFGGDWALGLGNFLEAGVGVGYYQNTVPSVYREFVDSDGTEVEQDLKLRIVPLTFAARVFPFGRRMPVQPYVGGGLGVFFWRYSETGEFIDDFDLSIFRATYKDSGSALGPVVFGGVRAAFDALLVGGEFRYQAATADLDPAVGFVTDELDLGGYTWLFTIGLRF